MNLREICIKKAYSSDSDDVLYDFYIPTLKVSVEYNRLAGFFSSTSLAIAARGILGLIKNGGIMKLIVSPKLDKNDLEIILCSYKEPEKYIEKKMLKELEKLEDEFVRDHVFALGWMVANKKLEIKVAIPYDNEGRPLSYEDIQQSGLFHQKVGILRDPEGNVITFSGSINETAAGWLGNIEEFKVFRSWESLEKEYVEADISKFNKFWNNQSRKVKVMDVPHAVKKRLIEIAPSNIEKINLQKWYKKVEPKKKIEFFPHQKAAIESWFKNNMKGIFEMATGTGKTYTALGCLKRLLEERDKLATVITCPYAHLVDQWDNNLKDFELNGVKAYGSYTQWSENVVNTILDYNNGYSSAIIILTTHDTFSSEKFRKIVSMINGEVLLIADEVHGLGAPERRRGLIENYAFRVGLSATPTRWFDDEGTQILKRYFGDTIYEFPLKRAIEEGYLTPYEYYPHFISLTDEELEQYRKETKRIAREYAKNKGEENKLIELLRIIRQKIVKNAVEKYRTFEEILDGTENLSFCLVYCSPEQINNVQKILNRRGIINHQFTARESIALRKEILKGFSEKAYDALVAMNCLDEGVDVPATRTAIIMASSGNPRQYIQRRGRILRKYPRKDKAIIHDFIVIPDISKETDPYLFELERKIMRKELRRYDEFARSAINYVDALNLIYPYMKKFNVYGGDAYA